MGYDQLALVGNSVSPLLWEMDRSVNRHALMVGRTGAGKSSELKKIVRQVRKTHPDAITYCFDCHGDLRFDGGKVFKINQSGDIGLNPLKISSHKEFGGVRAKVEQFVYTIESCQKQLGSKQESCLRNLLMDLFAQAGVDPDDHATWNIGTKGPDDADRVYLEVPFDEKDRFKEALKKEQVFGGWSREHSAWYCKERKGALTDWKIKKIQYQPDLADLLQFAKNKLVAVHRGLNNDLIRILQELGRSVNSLKTQSAKRLSAIDHEDALKMEANAAKLKEKALDLFSSYLRRIDTGDMDEDDIKYDSSDVLKSVVSRLENLLGTGIFKPVDPIFDDDDRIRIFDISALSDSAQRMFVSFFIESEFLKAKEAGITDALRLCFIVDEADKYFSNDKENIINKLAKESRKFGISLIAASQGIGHFSKEFISAVATKIILAIDEDNAKELSKRFNVPEQNLNKLKANHTVAFRTEYKGENDRSFKVINVNHAVMAKLAKIRPGIRPNGS